MYDDEICPEGRCHELIKGQLVLSQDLAAACSVCRTWNMWATPLLYRRMHIRIRDPDVSRDPPPVWVAALRALQKNDRQQCRAVNRFTIRGGFSLPEAWDDTVSVAST
jgi:hypothetical protein